MKDLEKWHLAMESCQPNCREWSSGICRKRGYFPTFLPVQMWLLLNSFDNVPFKNCTLNYDYYYYCAFSGNGVLSNSFSAPPFSSWTHPPRATYLSSIPLVFLLGSKWTSILTASTLTCNFNPFPLLTVCTLPAPPLALPKEFCWVVAFHFSQTLFSDEVKRAK